MEKVLFKSEEKKSTAEAAQFLRMLADKLETGTVTLKQGAEELNLDIPGNLVLEVKAEEETKAKGVKMSLEVELEWVPGGEETGGVELA